MKQYIERDAVIAHKRGYNLDGSYDDTEYAVPLNDILAIPAADVRPVVRGKWIDRDDDYYGWNMWACSACDEEFVLTEGTPDMNDYRFCPNCGAEMR